jgi:hypothetical protein
VRSVEKLVQRQRWKKLFGELFKKRFNGFLVNILGVLQANIWRIKIKHYDTTRTTLHCDIDDTLHSNQFHIAETV